MIYSEFQGKQLSMLGFGTMRLPLLPNGSIDEAQTRAMTDLAIRSGVNYFDTAWPYHGGKSEIVIGQALKAYPRESYYLADKYPGHQISSSYDPAAIFEEQLRKCGVDYFDFYLLHNVYESSMEVYLDPKWGILDYFKEQKRLGRIKHLGFSSHGRPENLKAFLDICGADMEFCQIQLNYLDWSLQDARAKVELLNAWNIPIWVMEPLRGGKLCKLGDMEDKLKAMREQETVPGWAFRFLQDIPGVKVILSGMSELGQMTDNLQTFAGKAPLSERERDALMEIAEWMKDSVPCTACRYCMDQCPMGLDIPALISTYNDIKVEAKTNPTMWLEAQPAEKQPTACIGCGQCALMCPQKIGIPAVLADLAQRLEKIPKWAEVCRERERAAAALRNK